MKRVMVIATLFFALAAGALVHILSSWADGPESARAASGLPEAAGVPGAASVGSGTGVAGGAAAPGRAEVPAGMQGQLRDIADAYAENARYPDYAKPLNANDWNLLHPRAQAPRKSPLANRPGVSAAVVLDRYILDRTVDQPLKVVLTAEAGTPLPAGGRVRVRVQQEGNRSAEWNLEPESAGGPVFSGVLPAATLRTMPPGESVVVAELDFGDGQPATVTAMINLYEPAARLLRLGDARVDNADLVIPAQFEVARAGHYLVGANLFSAGSNEPVSHLTAELDLTPANRTGQLKVHAVTLRAKRAGGPYVLRDVDLIRMPDAPGDLTGFGSTAAESFAVRGFPLDSYSNEPYQDPDARQKLEFLRQLAAGK